MKSPSTASLLSFLVTGLGQVYNGQVGKGILFFILAILGIFFTFAIGTIAIWIFSMVDAYQTAKQINARLQPPIIQTQPQNKIK